MICTQNKVCGLVTIQFSRDFVKSGVVVKVFTNAYKSMVYWHKSKFSWKHHKFSEFREYIQFEYHFSHNVQVLKTKMVEFKMICTQKKICGLVTIQFSRDFVKRGAVVKVFTNAYASTVYWQKSKFSSKNHKFAEFRGYFQLAHQFSYNVQVLKTKMVDL